ncbi:MAG: YecA family protein [Candidatus Dormibacteria bacterium]
MDSSRVTLDRFAEEERLSDRKTRRRIARSHRPLRSSAADLSDDELVAKLAEFGLCFDRHGLERLCRDALSAEEVAGPLIDSCCFGTEKERMQGDWIWICLVTLWQRWWPDKPCLELLDDKIQAGYHQLAQDQAVCAETWLSAWSDALRLCDATGIRSIEEFDDRFPMTQSLYNWSQDLEDTLWNAGLDSDAMLLARIAVCEEALQRFPHEDQLMTENRRAALAESYFKVGDTGKAEELFASWLAADPSWGFGWIAWAACHRAPADRDEPRDYDRAEQLLLKGYSTPGVRDREGLAEWLAIVCEETGRQLEARQFRRQARELERPAGRLEHGKVPVTVSHRLDLIEDENGEAAGARLQTTLKFGGGGLPLDQFPEALAALATPAVGEPAQPSGVARNAPCPCGSGKKFKRCCDPSRSSDHT